MDVFCLHELADVRVQLLEGPRNVQVGIRAIPAFFRQVAPALECHRQVQCPPGLNPDFLCFDAVFQPFVNPQAVVAGRQRDTAGSCRVELIGPGMDVGELARQFAEGLFERPLPGDLPIYSVAAD